HETTGACYAVDSVSRCYGALLFTIGSSSPLRDAEENECSPGASPAPPRRCARAVEFFLAGKVPSRIGATTFGISVYCEFIRGLHESVSPAPRNWNMLRVIFILPDGTERALNVHAGANVVDVAISNEIEGISAN